MFTTTNIKAQEVQYTIDKVEDLGQGFEAKYITARGVKSILIRFPNQHIGSDDTFNEGIKYAVTKLYGNKGFCEKCQFTAIETANALGIPMLILKTSEWELTIKPIVNDFIEFKIVGIEVVPRKLGTDL
jgi:hypothetical protein